MNFFKIITVFLSLWIFNASSLADEKSNSETLQILFSHDGMGELEPCGCRGNPLGGVVRRGSLVHSLKSNYSNTIQVDTGNTFFENTVTPESLKKVLQFQSEKIAESFKLLKINYFTPGEKDFSLGLNHLNRLKKISQSTFLAANLFDSNNKLIFNESILKKINQKKIYFIGLIGDDLSLSFPNKIKKPQEVLKSFIQKNNINSKEDILILLSECGMEKDKELAKEFKEITLIIGSRDQLFTQEPLKISETTIVQTSYRNQYLGQILIDLKTKSLKSQLLPLEEILEKDSPKEFLELIKSWKDKINQLSLKEEQSNLPVSKHSKPITVTKCIQCHEPQFNFWRKTSHTNALTALKSKNLLNHPDCLRCHTVKQDALLSWEENERILNEIFKAPTEKSLIQFKKDSPPLPMIEGLNTVDELSGGVQCENCHRTPENHPFSGKMLKEVREMSCLKCHTKERAPAWYDQSGLNKNLFLEKRKSIQCPKS